MTEHIFEQKALDGIVILSRVNRIYLSGFTGTDGILLITPDEKHLFVDSRYTLQAKEQAKGFTVTEYSSAPFELLEKYGFKRLGFEDKTILHHSYGKLPQCELVGVSEDIDKLRMVKSLDEIKKMQVAAQIADAAFTHILTFIKRGMTELQIANELEFFMRRQGASAMSFDPIVAAGERSALPHAYPSEREVKEGDLLLMDYGCVYDNYCSDMTRTVAVGSISDAQKEIYGTVLDAQQKARDSVKPGALCGDIDKIARGIITAAGYGENFGHSTGHGVGLEIHEEPRVSVSSEHVLEKGNVITVEPGIYVEGVGGVRIEDMVHVTDSGCCSFSESEKQLISI